MGNQEKLQSVVGAKWICCNWHEYCLIDHLLLAVLPPCTTMLSSKHMLSADTFLGSHTDYKHLHILYSCSETLLNTLFWINVSQKTLNEISNFCRQCPLNLTVTTFKSSHQKWKKIQNTAETTTWFEITSKELRISEYFFKSCMDPKDLPRTQQGCGQMVGESWPRVQKHHDSNF